MAQLKSSLQRQPTYFSSSLESNRKQELLFALKKPLIVFREGLTGGIFDNGVADIFVHEMPVSKPTKKAARCIEVGYLKVVFKSSRCLLHGLIF